MSLAVKITSDLARRKTCKQPKNGAKLVRLDQAALPGFCLGGGGLTPKLSFFLFEKLITAIVFRRKLGKKRSSCMIVIISQLRCFLTFAGQSLQAREARKTIKIEKVFAGFRQGFDLNADLS